MNALVATIDYSDAFKQLCRKYFPNDQKLNHGVDTGQLEVGVYLKGLTVIPASPIKILEAVDAHGNYSHASADTVSKIRSAANADFLLTAWRGEVKDIFG